MGVVWRLEKGARVIRAKPGQADHPQTDARINVAEERAELPGLKGKFGDGAEDSTGCGKAKDVGKATGRLHFLHQEWLISTQVAKYPESPCPTLCP